MDIEHLFKELGAQIKIISCTFRASSIEKRQDFPRKLFEKLGNQNRKKAKIILLKRILAIAGVFLVLLLLNLKGLKKQNSANEKRGKLKALLLSNANTLTPES